MKISCECMKTQKNSMKIFFTGFSYPILLDYNGCCFTDTQWLPMIHRVFTSAIIWALTSQQLCSIILADLTLPCERMIILMDCFWLSGVGENRPCIVAHTTGPTELSVGQYWLWEWLIFTRDNFVNNFDSYCLVQTSLLWYLPHYVHYSSSDY